ncbi:MAG TPA: response regulator [Crinalium sp.]
MAEPSATVLHIEDNEANRYVVRRVLQNAGFHIVEAVTGEAGLKAVTEHQPDLVILDVKLPGINGFEVCRQIKSNPQTTFIPVLHLSASFVKGKDKAAGLDSGADAYLAQPVEPIELLATVRSLLRIREAEEAALSLAREWQTTFDSIRDGVGLLDQNGRFLRCNSVMTQLLGKPWDDISGQLHQDLLQEAIGISDGICFQQTKSTCHRQTVELHAGDRWFLKTIDPVLDEQKNFRGAVFILSNITDQKRAEAATRVSEERFRLLLDNVQDYAILFCDPQGIVTRWSLGAEKILGYQETEILGKSASCFFTADDLANGVDRFELVQAATAGRAEDERWQVRKDGSRFWASGITTPLYNETEQLRGFCKILRDFTERKRIEDERAQLLVREQEARAASEVANRLKDEFLATLSHELRSPLNAILGWIRLLNTRNFDSTTTARAMETIERNARSQAQLVEDLLDVSRIIQGKLRLNIRSVNLIAVIEAAIDAVRPSADAKDIQIQSLFAPSVSTITGDGDRLQQVVWNLLSNAVKFTPSGGQVWIRLEKGDGEEKGNKRDGGDGEDREDKGDECVQITVTDTGQGINPEFVPFVFERFRQADSSTTRTYSGLGLGLAIVRHLVELHGGTVHASSPGAGKGSTFTVRLPLTPMRLDVYPHHLIQPNLSEQLSYNHSPQLNGVRVLVVDDEIDAREMLAAALETAGATVIPVISVAEAIATISNAKADVLISDISMPEEDGYSLIRKVRMLPATQGGTIPAIALTAYARTEDQSRALTEGFHMHLSKPVEPTQLASTVASLIRQSR